MTDEQRRLSRRAHSLARKQGQLCREWGQLGSEAKAEGLWDWLIQDMAGLDDAPSETTLRGYVDVVEAVGDSWSDRLSFAVHAAAVGAPTYTPAEATKAAQLRGTTLPPGLRRSGARRSLKRLLDNAPDQGWTRAEARRFLGQRAGDGHDPVQAPESPEVRAARVADDLRDPEVRRAVERDDTARETLYHATADMTRRKVEDNKETYRRVAPDTVSVETVMHLARQTRMYRRVVVESLTELSHHSLSDDEKEVLMDQVTELNDVLGWLTTYLSSGDTSWDEALAALQEGEL